MRRDFFLCFFLLCIATSLLFVCLQPLYFTYDIIVPREFGLLEKFLSLVVAGSFLLVIPIIAAIKRKFWISAGLACYGLLAYIPGWILPGMTDKISGSGAKLTSVIYASCLKGLYGMVNAPFASLSKLLGDNMAASLSKKILPIALLSYILVQLYRFYRDAYVRDKLSAKQVDPSIERGEEARAAEPEDKDVLGTVVLAPVGKDDKKIEVKPSKREPVKSETKAIPKLNKEDLKALNHDDVILLGAPSFEKTETGSETKAMKKVTQEDIIKLGPPSKPVIEKDSSKPDVIKLGPPAKPVIKEETPKKQDVIKLGPPPAEVKTATAPVKAESSSKAAPAASGSVKPQAESSSKPKLDMDSSEIAKMNKMFEEFITNYETQTKKKVSGAEKQTLYLKFVDLYKQQNKK